MSGRQIPTGPTRETGRQLMMLLRVRRLLQREQHNLVCVANVSGVDLKDIRKILDGDIGVDRRDVYTLEELRSEA